MSMNFVTFNQDYSHLAVGMFAPRQESSRALMNGMIATSRGFRIYTTDPFSQCFETKQGDIALLEMLFSTSLVALILSPRRLQITNTKVRRFLISFAGWANDVRTMSIGLAFTIPPCSEANANGCRPRVETIDDMRAHLPNHGPGSSLESKTAGGDSGGPDLPV